MQRSLWRHIELSQLRREKSLVLECSGNRQNWCDISKGIFRIDISEFESSMPSSADIPSDGHSTVCGNMRVHADLAPITWSDEKNCPAFCPFLRAKFRRVWGAELPISEILAAACPRLGSHFAQTGFECCPPQQPLKLALEFDAHE